MDLICSQAEYFKSAKYPAMLAALKAAFPEFNSSMLEMTFLRYFYIDSLQGAPVETHIYNCYERLLNIFITKRMEREYNEQDIYYMNKRYQAWLKENENSFGYMLGEFLKNLPTVIYIGVIAFAIYAVKK